MVSNSGTKPINEWTFKTKIHQFLCRSLGNTDFYTKIQYAGKLGYRKKEGYFVKKVSSSLEGEYTKFLSTPEEIRK